jgi:hypothetical protein
MPHPTNGDQTAAVNLRPTPHLAQNLVASLESSRGEGMHLPRHGKDSILKKSSKPDNSYSEEEMENTRKLNPDLGTIAWGALFILWGITEMFKSLPEGTGAIGIGIILIGLNLARLWNGQPTNGFTTTFGILMLLLGALQLARPYLHLSFELPIFAILLLALGLIMLGSSLRGNKNHE